MSRTLDYVFYELKRIKRSVISSRARQGAFNTLMTLAVGWLLLRGIQNDIKEMQNNKVNVKEKEKE